MNICCGKRYLVVQRNKAATDFHNDLPSLGESMKYFKLLFFVFITVFFWGYGAEAASLSCGSNPGIVGKRINCTFTPDSAPVSITWTFGDGSPADNTGIVETNSHVYTAAGKYTINASDSGAGGQASSNITINAAPTLAPAAPAATKRIDHRPTRPAAGERVLLTAVNFNSRTCVGWNYGDKTKRERDVTPPTIEHVFERPGRYKVMAYDNCDWNSVPVPKWITVGRDTRTTTYTPMDPKVNQRITFTTRGYYDRCKRVDFGDGTIRTVRTPVYSHFYRNPGTYTVRIYGYCGAGEPQILTITVVKGFSIDRVELNFKDTAPGAGTTVPSRFMGLAPTVERGTRNFRATALINYSGSGVITMQWLVDNRVIQMVTKQVVKFKNRIKVDSIVDLPTYTLGRHDVSVRFISPRGENIRMPVLKYFVIQPQEKTNNVTNGDLSVALLHMTNSRGETTEVNGVLKMIPDDYSILGGAVYNQGRGEFSNGRLNIYRNGSLLDSQVILNLIPGGEKPFEVSMKMEDGKMELTFVVMDKDGNKITQSEQVVEPAL